MQRRVLIALCASLAALIPNFAAAQYGQDSLGANLRDQQGEAQRCRQQGCLPLPQVIAIIQRQAPGKVLDAGLESGPNGQPIYRVRWAASNGRRMDFLVDAVKGAILQVEGR